MMTNEMLQHENDQLKVELDILRRYLEKAERFSEFAAASISLTTHPVIGIQRWDKDVMVSFFPVDIEGKRIKYASGIDKVFDLFLTCPQMERLIREWNEQSTDKPFESDNLQ